MDFKPVSLITGYEAFTNFEIKADGILRNVKTGRILIWNPKGAADLHQNGNLKAISKQRAINILFHDNEEIWGKLSNIPGFEDPVFESYEVFKNAEIRPTTGKRAYSKITYGKNRGYLLIRIQGRAILKHRLLAAMFIPNPEGRRFVDHIDGNPSNNELSNLRWVSSQENSMNRGKLKNNTSGIPNIYATTKKGERKYWEIHISKSNKDGSLTHIYKIFKRETREIPSYIIELRHELVKELFGEFARQF